MAPETLDAPPLQQSPEFAAALTALGRPPWQSPDGTGWLIQRRRFAPGFALAMVSRARITPERVPRALENAGLGLTPVILAPDRPCPDLAETGAIRLFPPATVAELDLRRPTAERRAAMHQKWRNRLRYAERGPLFIRRTPFPDDPDHWLLRADAEQQRTRGYRSWPAALTLAWTRANPGRAILFTACEGDRPVAAMLFLRHGRAATYHIGHTTDRGRAFCAHNLILWQAADWLARRNCHRLDLGLIDRARLPGLARFKLGIGATARPLGGTWLWWPPAAAMARPATRLFRRVAPNRRRWTGQTAAFK